MKCDYCDKTLSNKYSLVTHQQTAKYCLKLQGKNNYNFQCIYCKRNLSTKNHLDSHYNSCTKKKCKDDEILNINKIKELKIILDKKNIYIDERARQLKEKDNQIIEYKEQLKAKDKQYIKQLKDKDIQIKELLEQVVKRPTNTTNMINNDNRIQQINNLIPITDEHMNEQAQYLTIEHIKQGGPGYTQYALEYPFKGCVMCVDYARKKVIYKDEDGNIITDPNLCKLAQKLFQSIMTRNKEIIDKYRDEEYKKAGLHQDCTKEEKKKHSTGYKIVIMNNVSALYSTNRQVQSIAEGGKEQMLALFTKDLCAKTVG